MIALWLRGLLSSLSGRLIGAMIGIAVTIVMLSFVGAFTATSAASMTRQAIANVSVDWQIRINHGADSQTIKKAVAAATGFTAMQEVFYASVPGFELQNGPQSQTTGSGKVVGIAPAYARNFPAEFRTLIGKSQGVLLAQQTAANLHARIGDRIRVKRDSLPPISVTIDGIIDLPNADSFFQAVGLPAGASPQAPPDNVLILPANQWHQFFDPQTARRPDSTQTQLHVRILRDLPGDPLAAYTLVDGRAKNVEARIAGSGVIGDNLAAKLLGTQADALYARVLFLFLGFPGVILAGILTLAVIGSGQTRRLREQALLRIRGASTAVVVGLSALETLIIGGGGIILGALAFFAARPHPSPTDLAWFAESAAAGLLLAIGATIIPAYLQMRSNTVRASRLVLGRSTASLWERLYVDLILLAIGSLVYWQTAAGGYQVVLAPEGVPQSTVHYQAFLGPLLLWLGVTLVAVRVCRLFLLHGTTALTALCRAIAGPLAPVIASSLSRQWKLVTRGLALVLLAFSFGIATAVFNATYEAQSLVDAQLTNGADVSASGMASAPAPMLERLRAIPGVIAAQPMLHRFAYVGNDLQDLYGVDPTAIGLATTMSNAFFGNADARASLAILASRPDSVLVSEETVTSYQLHLGDRLTLRLQDGKTHRYVPVSFHFAGISREFPTAPHDSFLIANAAYVARATRAAGAEFVLMRVTPGAIGIVERGAKNITSAVPGAHVSTILETQHSIGSTLTALDLHGLTTLELFFAALFIATATGLMLALGIAERRRAFAILSAIGARPSQLGAFLWTEALAIVVPGAIFGIALGIGVAQMLVKVLTGVFDPPPEALVFPWTYIWMLIGAAVFATAIAVSAAQRAVQSAVATELRSL
ncbi:MAG: ABC transporter permease [Candidatus Eremiobacteraeota bacterium]|nr:ABC transporter permease [Candidatus Eremiobacteraeota bacterium]